MRGIEGIDVQRHIDRRADVDRQPLAAGGRFDRLHAEASPLLAMMVVDGAQANLDQPVRQPFLHDPREGRGMGAWIALVGMVDVRVRVDVQDGQLRVVRAEGTQDRMGQRMVAAEADQRLAGGQNGPGFAFDSRPGVFALVEAKVATVDEPARFAEVDARLAPVAVRIRVKLAADRRGR